MTPSDYPLVDIPDILLAAVDRAGDGLVIVDEDHRVRHFSRTAEEIWGIARTEVIGHDAGLLGLKALPQPDLPAMTGETGAAHRNPRHRPEMTVVRKDGSR